MKKEFWIVIILAIIIIVLTGLLFWPIKPAKNIQTQNIAGIEIISPKPNEAISSPLKIAGIVNGGGWSGFEGQVGTVKLLDNAGKELASGILTTTTEWKILPVNFETTLSFQSFFDSSGTLVFHNENPSGDPLRDKTFILPVKIKSNDNTKEGESQNTVKIK